MIASLRGVLREKAPERAVIDVGGVGYEVAVNPATAARLPDEGSDAELYVAESVGMYGGGVTLYGFVSRDERQMFEAFRHLPSTGAKKALEHLEKASKSLPDFRRAILDQDVRMLHGIFGFTRKTADRLLAGLKDKLGAAPAGAEKVMRPAGTSSAPLAKALDALSSLGYKGSECRSALDEVQRELSGREASVEEIIRIALRKL